MKSNCQRFLHFTRRISFNMWSIQFQILIFKCSYHLQWVEAKRSFGEAEAMLLNGQKSTIKTIWGQFWSAHQRFFKYLCIAAKVDHAVKVAKEAVEDGKCVVIGLQSTGEARTLDVVSQDDFELTDFISTAK